MAAQNRLLSNSVGNINEMILKNTHKCIARIEDPKVFIERMVHIQDPLQKGKEAVEWTLKNILISCEDVFKTHMYSLED